MLREARPPDDLWERAIQRTASVLLEGLPPPVDVSSLLIRNFLQVARKRKTAQCRVLPISEAAAAISIEGAVVAQIDFKKIMRNLHPEDREILILRFMAGWTWVEIAAMKGQSTHALRKRCARAAEQLRRKFGAYSSRSRITKICEVLRVFLSRKPSAY